MRSISSALVLAVGLVFGGTAHATPVVYTFQGTASGTVDGMSFSGQLLTLEVFGDTANVASLSFPIGEFGGAMDRIQAGTRNTLTIGTLWNGMLDTGAGMTSMFYSLPTLGAVDGGVGTPSPNHQVVVFELHAPALVGYDARSSIGPVFDEAPAFDTDVLLAGGARLQLTGFTHASFSATAAAPEPATAALVAPLLLVVASARARRRASLPDRMRRGR